MSRHGNLDMGGSGRIINLPDPIAAREPALNKDVMVFPRGSGRLIANNVNALATTTGGVVANQFGYSILENRRDCTVNSLFNEVTTVVAASLFRAAIYTLNPVTLYPDKLVIDGGADRSGAVLGQVGGAVLPVSLPAGVYACVLKSSAAIGFRAFAPGAISTLLGFSGTNSVTRVTGALAFVANTPFPATFPTITATNIVNSSVTIFTLNVV